MGDVGNGAADVPVSENEALAGELFRRAEQTAIVIPSIRADQ
jgi:hypothetical protein